MREEETLEQDERRQPQNFIEALVLFEHNQLSKEALSAFTPDPQPSPLRLIGNHIRYSFRVHVNRGEVVVASLRQKLQQEVPGDAIESSETLIYHDQNVPDITP